MGIWAFSIGTSIGWGSFVITCNTYLAQAGILGTLAGLGIGLALFLLIVRNLQYMIRHGANAGDEYIRSACTMICRQYKHSPVFRIGGDEFVVILEGEDYAGRDQLLAEINKLSENHQQEDGPVISVGMADFDVKRDGSLQSVFEAADERMYARKKYLKTIVPGYR